MRDKLTQGARGSRRSGDMPYILPRCTDRPHKRALARRRRIPASSSYKQLQSKGPRIDPCETSAVTLICNLWNIENQIASTQVLLCLRYLFLVSWLWDVHTPCWLYLIGELACMRCLWQDPYLAYEARPHLAFSTFQEKPYSQGDGYTAVESIRLYVCHHLYRP